MSLDLSNFITGTGNITYTVAGLPSGLIETAGTISGSPSTFNAASKIVSITAQDDNGTSSTTVTFPSVANAGGGAETVDFTTAATLPSASASDNINQQIVATGSQGSTPVTYTFISINNSGNSNTSTATPFTLTGNTISGIAPRLLNAATYSLEIQASIQAGTITNNRTFTLLISQDATCVSPTNNICT